MLYRLLHILLFVFLFSNSLFAQTKSPNIVFILADDLGWKDLSFNGSKFYETPNIDQLASEGVFFSNAYSNAPICSPSRAALISGQYGARTGFFTNHSPERGKAAWRAVLPPENHHGLGLQKITIAEALKSSGYKTFFAGKWHLGDSENLYPEHQGFDINVGGHKAGKPSSYFSPYNNPRLSDGEPGEFLTDRLTSEAIQFIETNKANPFFTFISYYAPHSPLQAKDSLIWKYIPKEHDNGQFDPYYAAMIETLDYNVGRIMDCLKKQSLTEKTIVVFFSDNGTSPFVAPEKPFRGFKGTLYEGGIRVPLIIKHPKITNTSKINNTPVIGTDLYPTIIDFAGIKPPNDYPLDGRSLRPLLEKKEKYNHGALFWHFPAYLQGEYGMTDVWRTTPVSAVRLGNYKLIEFLEDGNLELYNLKDDQGEKNNIAETEKQKTKELFKLLNHWRKELNVPYPLERNPEYNSNSIPAYLKTGNRSDIYKTNFKK